MMQAKIFKNLQNTHGVGWINSLSILYTSCIRCGRKLTKARKCEVSISVSFSGDLNVQKYYNNLKMYPILNLLL